MKTAHCRRAYNGMRSVDCIEPSVQYVVVLIARMAENIDTPCSLSCVSGLEGLILTRPGWHAVLELEARQRALKWNFNELQYALPPSEIFPFDFKSGCLWMLSLKLSAVQRSQVLKTASDLCVTARVDQNSLVSPVFFPITLLSSPSRPRMTDRQTCPSISSPHCGNLSANLPGCILAVWPIFINTSLSHLEARSDTALRDMEGGSAVYPSLCPRHVFSRGHHSMGAHSVSPSRSL